MKKKILLALSLVTGSLAFFGCQSTEQKQKTAEATVQETQKDLIEARNDVNEEAKKSATNEEWSAYRNQMLVKIQANEKQIAVLKAKMDKSGKLLDAAYAKKIESLEDKNNELKQRMDEYEKSQSDWESFKREFNHDINELENALKDIMVDNND